MASKEVSKKESGEVDQSSSSAYQKTTEAVSSAAASLGGAFNFSGGVSANAGSYNKKTTTTTVGGEQLSKSEADKLYEERIEDEYAKREGGAWVGGLEMSRFQE